MLVLFRVENYRSLGPAAELSMVASEVEGERNTSAVAEGPRLLRSAAVYGANASGKSNLVGALELVRTMVLDSSHKMQDGDPIDVEAFRLLGKDGPSRFEVVFLLDGMEYRYGFQADPVSVSEEWLYCRRGGEEETFFERTGQEITLGPEFHREGAGLEVRTRENALFLSVVAQFNGEIAGRVRRWFGELFVMSGLNDYHARHHTEIDLDDEAQRAAIVRWVMALDLGIDGIEVVKQPIQYVSLEPSAEPLRTRYRIVTLHRQRAEDGQILGTARFDLSRHESEGTRKLFALAGPLLSALQHGRCVVIDEFDARLHPLLTRQLVGFFHDPEINKRGAQLVFTTHDTNLLDASLFRRDQVWFVEKDRGGASHLYSLAEFRARDDGPLEENYIQGRYGAIPFLGDLRRALGEAGDE